MASKKPENLSFEEAISELSTIVTEMEHGDLPLETALKQFERGIALASASSQKLEQAQQKVQILMGQNDNAQLVDFNQ
ncbi:MAG: exodeoxyribonuclease VII small subunit [Pseudoalteromonas spongiae]|uniref:Exodeoxyribonuclease 7 small subunit n=1 Tax=Pseudoalteromonas spongiae TaxID=298657 RepID=A0ABU8ESU8_9GAMM|nr:MULTISPECIES: exodeoxyribonuclease VII small subunit [Pseudoalteromonas]MEC8324817.1 exodeoxyribonuclease VII small subunit [Pseudomonadota bacterium]ATC99263.1 exodeoxyribonuclease VII small subunit [Pseudoalteromonas spongiae UST010723-006]KPV95440.1 Exodeoxyribonuclease 7 small subunit [Pseudoalteromonas sp. P1-9]MCF6456760.1 exodeoxyribonuclease VII small subunit [Pseudoalteromonas sp. MMG024]TMO82546.1 exodeoxyribonuclease VII small subunit [Pseudoalteromonas spongiae]|tara:strand:- start:17 stop:250 length:234 start_codon:yes stop_codon:yes gene_type:complete